MVWKPGDLFSRDCALSIQYNILTLKENSRKCTWNPEKISRRIWCEFTSLWCGKSWFSFHE